jgi:hypothetical protein
MSKSMRLTLALAVPVALFALAFLALPSTGAAANTCPQAVHMAQSAGCVQAQLDLMQSSAMYKESSWAEDMGGGMMRVVFMYEPKCLDAKVPCRIATLSITATVNCNDNTVTCP